MAEGEPTPARGLLVDKPAGVTSHDVVTELRRQFGAAIVRLRELGWTLAAAKAGSRVAREDDR